MLQIPSPFLIPPFSPFLPLSLSFPIPSSVDVPRLWSSWKAPDEVVVQDE